MTGGVGSRLWPLSRKNCPKQYLKIFQGKSLFELTVERNQTLVKKTVVVGNQSTIHLSKNVFNSKEIEQVAYIIESEPRNTAAAICLACLALEPSDIVLVCPSDHLVGNQEAYEQAIREAYSLAVEDHIVTIGIQANYPETGYGYIQHQGNNVIAFHEKPSLENASNYIKSGNYLWNAGIFCFQVGVFLKELTQYEPEIYIKSAEAWKAQVDGFIPMENMQQIPTKSIDYAVMEKSQKLKVVAADMAWSDLGSFDAMWDYQENISQGSEAAYSNFVIGQSQKHVELVGVENLIVVETDDAILVVPRYQSQKVKEVYERLQVEKSNLI